MVASRDHTYVQAGAVIGLAWAMAKVGPGRTPVSAALGIAAFVALAAFFGYKWLARDELNRSYACGIGSWRGTCFEGEAMNIVLSLFFASVATFGIVLTVRAVRSHGAVDTAAPENDSDSG